MPCVSVIIPFFQSEKYIERCATSLFEQSLVDIEFIFINDGSSDASLDILQRVIDNYPSRKSQIHILHMKSNSGQAISRKYGLDNASGEYVIQCDSDDWVDRDLYLAMYKSAKREDADVVLCDIAQNESLNNVKILRGYHSKGNLDFIKNAIYQTESWSLCNKLFKRSMIDASSIVFPSASMGEDMVVVLQLMAKCKTITYVTGVNYHYFYNRNSTVHSLDESRVFDNYYQLRENTGIVSKALQDFGFESKVCERLLLCLSVNSFSPLGLIMHSSDAKKCWKSQCPRLPLSFLLHNYMPLKTRIVYVCNRLNINPYSISRKLFSN